MQALATTSQIGANAGPWMLGTALTVDRLTQDHESEVLAFLAERPAHTFGMVGFIHANGIGEPPQPR